MRPSMPSLTSLILVMVTICGGLIGCGEAKELGPQGTKVLPVEPEPLQDGDDVTPGDQTDQVTSEQAFRLTVYPVVRQYCAACHASFQGPLFAAEDHLMGHAATVEAAKVNFRNPEDSRLVLRLNPDEHHCWSENCHEDAAEMLAAIERWIELARLTQDPDPQLAMTDPLFFRERITGLIRQNITPGTLIWEAENATTMTAPMRVVQEGGVSGGAFIEVPTGNGGQINNVNTVNNGRVTYQINVTEPGTYWIWGLVQGATNQNNSFFVRMNNGAFSTWILPVTENEWAWSRANQNGQNAISFNLEAGTHTLELRRHRVASRLDLLAVSNQPSFVGAAPNVNVEVAKLSYDISSLVGVAGARFLIEVSRYDDFSFKFERPELVVPRGAIELSSLRVLINGREFLQSTTYALLSETVAAPGKVLSEAAMIVPFDTGFDTDEISFSFGTLEAR